MIVDRFLLDKGSISICDSFRSTGRVKDGREHSDFAVADVSSPEVLGLFGVGKFHKESHDVIGASIGSFIPLSEAGVVVFILHVGQAAFGASIVVGSSVVTISVVAPEPFLEPHSAHDVVIWH